MVTTIEKPMIYTSAANQKPTVLAQGTAYKYDQLNRIKEMKAYANLNYTTNTWQSGSTYAGMYHNRFNYDGMGNITWQQRADSSGTIFDKLRYRYKLDANGKLAQNRLYHVNDSITNKTLAHDDIEDEGNFASSDSVSNFNNYRYDEIGDLKHDSQEEIDTITWTVYGKIKKIVRTDTSSKPDLEFNYDAGGNRISKIVKPHGSSVENGGTDISTQWTSTYYVRDAQGNIMTTYKLAAPAMASSFKVTERNLFGNSRLGTDDTQIELIAALPTANPYTRTLGNKHYEASNHLGNVLTVFTDRKIPVTSDGTTIDHFDADVINTFDYSPFGAPMNERTYRLAHVFTNSAHTDTVWAFVNGNEPLANIASDSLGYRYGFNGKEKDDEIEGGGNAYDFGARIYDARLGIFLSIDPRTRYYPHYSPYLFAGNTPLQAIDEDGEGVLLAAALISAGLELFQQTKDIIKENRANGRKAFYHYLRKIDYADVLIEAGKGVAAVMIPGGGKFIDVASEYLKAGVNFEIGEKEEHAEKPHRFQCLLCKGERKITQEKFNEEVIKANGQAIVGVIIGLTGLEEGIAGILTKSKLGQKIIEKLGDKSSEKIFKGAGEQTGTLFENIAGKGIEREISGEGHEHREKKQAPHFRGTQPLDFEKKTGESNPEHESEKNGHVREVK
jgi:RHS repeat-associated protein